MFFNVNCVQCDRHGRCNKKPKVLRVFKRSCVEYGMMTETCDIAERYPRPKLRFSKPLKPKT